MKIGATCLIHRHTGSVWRRYRGQTNSASLYWGVWGDSKGIYLGLDRVGNRGFSWRLYRKSTNERILCWSWLGGGFSDGWCWLGCWI